MSEQKFCRFYIVRHGETEWNVNRILQGHMDSPLTEKGIHEAIKLSALFRNQRFADVFSSDLFRAKRTAEIIATEHKLAVKTNELLRECFFGEYEGKKVEEFVHDLKDLIEYRETLSDEERFTFKLGHDIETNEQMVSRFIIFLRQVSLVHLGEKVLVVSHGGMMRSLLVRLGFGTFKELEHGAVKNLGYFILDSDGTDFFIKETFNIEKKT